MDAGARIEEAEIIDLLASLSDRSLITLDQTPDGPRYRLLETVRQYGRDLLAEDQESPRLFAKHLDYYVQLSENCEPKLKGSGQMEALALLEREYENLRVALERGVTGGGSEEALLLAANLAVFWWRQGHFMEGVEWCLRAASTNVGEQRTVLRARVLNAAGLLLLFQGDCTRAKELYGESRSILEEMDDRRYLPEALCGTGFALFFLDDYAGSEELLIKACQAASEVDDAWYLAWSGYMNGIIKRINGDFDGAIRAYEQALRIFKKLGDRIAASYPTYDIGLAQYYRGNLEVAQKYLAESLAIRRDTSDLWGMSESLFGLGLVCIGKKEHSVARTFLQESKEVAKQIGDKTRVAICAHWLGHIALVDRDSQQALQQFAESLEIYQVLDDRWGLSHCLAGSAAIAAKQGDWTIAVELWAAADKLREDIRSPLPPVERALREEQLAEAHVAIDANAFDEAWADGRQLELRDALDLASSLLA